MNDAILLQLQITEDMSEKATLVAEFVLHDMPEHLVLAARRCVILHWFDLPLVRALLQDRFLVDDEIQTIYKQLSSLPFIETLPWGLAIQDLTREGLLKQYARIQPEFLRTAARFAASEYHAREARGRYEAEAFFCYLVAGNQQFSLMLLDTLLSHASQQQDWQYIHALFSLQSEAERLPFVRPLPLSEAQQFLRDLVCGMQEMQKLRPIDDREALLVEKAHTYISRGMWYASQQQFKKARSNYDQAFQLDSARPTVYTLQGLTSMAQGNYLQAIDEFTLTLASDPDNIFVLLQQGLALDECGNYTEALDVYEHILHIDPKATRAYTGKGKALNRLNRYEEALTVYEQGIRLNPYDLEAYEGKGTALSQLGRYAEAHIAYESARQLAAPTVEENEEIQQTSTDNKRLAGDRIPIFNLSDSSYGFRLGPKPLTSFKRALENSHLHQQPIQKRQGLFWIAAENSLATLAVAIIIVAASILFPLIRSTETGAGGPTPPPPQLVMTPTSLNFSNVAQGTTATQQVTVRNSGGQPLNWSLGSTSLPVWLSVNTISSTVQPGSSQTLNVTANTSDLSPGSYSATLNFTSNGGKASVSVILAVNAPPLASPKIAVSPNSLDFGAMDPGTTKTLQETISNSGGQPLNWSWDSTSLPSWLSVDITSGTLQAGSSQTMDVAAITSNLSPGSYSATLNFTSNGGNAQAQVKLTVNAPPPVMQVSPNPLDFGTVTSGQTTTLTEIVSNSGGQQLIWSLDIISLPSWLSVDRGSGTVQAGNSQPINVTATTSNLSPGNYSATLNFTSNGGNAQGTVTITVQ